MMSNMMLDKPIPRETLVWSQFTLLSSVSNESQDESPPSLVETYCFARLSLLSEQLREKLLQTNACSPALGSSFRERERHRFLLNSNRVTQQGNNCTHVCILKKGACLPSYIYDMIYVVHMIICVSRSFMVPILYMCTYMCTYIHACMHAFIDR